MFRHAAGENPRRCSGQRTSYLAIGVRCSDHKEILGLWIERTEGGARRDRTLFHPQATIATPLATTYLTCWRRIRGLIINALGALIRSRIEGWTPGNCLVVAELCGSGFLCLTGWRPSQQTAVVQFHQVLACSSLTGKALLYSAEEKFLCVAVWIQMHRYHFFALCSR